MSKAFVAERQEKQAKQAAGLVASPHGGGAKADKDNTIFERQASPPRNERKQPFWNQPRHIRHQARTFHGAGQR